MVLNDDGVFSPCCDVMMWIGSKERLDNCVDVLVDGLVTGFVILFCWPLTFDANLDFSPLMTL